LYKILIANNTANIAENIVFVRTFRPSTCAIVNSFLGYNGVTSLLYVFDL